MNLAEAEDKVLDHFRRNGFALEEWPSLHLALEWRPRLRVTRVRHGRTSEAAMVVREDGSSYKQPHNWYPLLEARRQLPALSIYFAIPANVNRQPLLGELQELGVGLYVIQDDGILIRVQDDRVPFEDTIISYPIVPNLPYRNRMNLYKVFSNCTDYLWWLDKHFLLDGLSLFDDWCHCGTPSVRELKVLGSNAVERNELSRLRRNFSAFRTEMGKQGLMPLSPECYG